MRVKSVPKTRKFREERFFDSGTGWKKMNGRLAGKGDLGTALDPNDL